MLVIILFKGKLFSNILLFLLLLPLLVVPDPCESNPCDNGGTCIVQDPYVFRCTCLAGFIGAYCEEHINMEDCHLSCPPETICQNTSKLFQCVPLSTEKESEFSVVVLWCWV